MPRLLTEVRARPSQVPDGWDGEAAPRTSMSSRTLLRFSVDQPARGRPRASDQEVASVNGPGGRLLLLGPFR